LVYGESNQALDDVEMEIDKLIDRTFITEDIHVENAVVSKLTKEKLDILRRQSETHNVHITIDLNRIRIKGNDINVHKMLRSANELLEDVKKAIREMEQAKEMHKTIKWIRVDSDDDEEYSVEESYEIERAYRFRKGTGNYTHQSESQHFTIDFSKLQEKDHKHTGKLCVVKRTDILREAEDGELNIFN